MSEIKRVDGVYFRGNATDCIEGAWNEYKAAHGGLIVFAGIHAYFIPPHAKPTDTAKNLGREYDANGHLMTSHFYEPTAVEDVLLAGQDITNSVISKYSKKV
ncbi:hypothetical protein COV87_02255 [Candidatus Roizmanbacteria bacterium CG11_big_fil_rev_8_21_14_0_20_37_16]|uniref:Uncharacterized protein n=1 Tax=Candidatus Roizmanbacteria bacterium CG11_big_fil_rev_8_21_14_0_20_37_16 TaxID=1974857 RepID=A0A2H0KK68_9BACT|nr:MAG: hypothetical protein COV87_02255 [Candidatus Roizmanbacteria bacterium CG11_big_fil_rev_8_21_14_0_20_37_16]